MTRYLVSSVGCADSVVWGGKLATKVVWGGKFATKGTAHVNGAKWSRGCAARRAQQCWRDRCGAADRCLPLGPGCSLEGTGGELE